MKMSEHYVQRVAVGQLRKAGVRFFAVPNGGLRTGATAAKLWQEGVSSGVPDLVIVDPPSTGKVGTVVEVKTDKGRVSPEQQAWLDAFSARGWEARVAYGLTDLIRVLCELGYLDSRLPTVAAIASGNTAPSPTEAAPPRAVASRGRPSGSQRRQPTSGKGEGA